jgi:Fic family protein
VAFAFLTSMPIHTLERSSAPQTRVTSATSLLLQRIQNEYREMPGLILTEDQARRLWAIDTNTCRRVLAALLERRFLKRTAAGAYVRASD